MAGRGEKGGGGKDGETCRGLTERQLTATKLYSAIKKVEKFMASLRANKEEINAWNTVKKAAVHINKS